MPRSERSLREDRTASRRGRVFGTPFLLLLMGALLLPAFAADPRDPPSLGPAPRDAEGRFTNWHGDPSHGTWGVRLPFFLRRLGGLFRDRPGAPTRQPNDGAFLRENAKHSVPTVTWIGHATLLVQQDHVTYLTDPIWSDSTGPIAALGPRRLVPPGVALEDLPPIDFVLLSHDHFDHLDLPTLVALARRNPATRFLAPLGNAELLRGEGIEAVEEFDWGDATREGQVTIHCLPAQHWSRRGLTDERKRLWSSWAVVGPERRFYFAGDTGYFEGFVRIGEALGPFDLAAVPIGAYAPTAMMKESHMDPEEAVRAAIDVGARKALAMHYGTFDLSDEPLDEPPRGFIVAAGESADLLPPETAWILRIGETRRF